MRKFLIGALAASTLLVAQPLTEVAHATDDDPCGSLHDFKVEPLSGKTFTVPTPPAGWTVEYVVIKVGGPGGGTHITFDPATPGQVLSVAYQQYDISHAHVCKSRVYPPTTTSTTTTTAAPTTSSTTTTEVTTSTSSTTTSTSSPSTSTTSTPPTTDGTTTTTTVAQSSTTTDPATTTSTVAPSTTGVSTSTSTTTVSPSTSAPTTTGAPTRAPDDVVVGTCIDSITGQPTMDTTRCGLPSTGADDISWWVWRALVALLFGIVLVMATRRPETA